jgi:hypothetical protein
MRVLNGEMKPEAVAEGIWRRPGRAWRRSRRPCSVCCARRSPRIAMGCKAIHAPLCISLIIFCIENMQGCMIMTSPPTADLEARHPGPQRQHAAVALGATAVPHEPAQRPRQRRLRAILGLGGRARLTRNPQQVGLNFWADFQLLIGIGIIQPKYWAKWHNMGQPGGSRVPARRAWPAAPQPAARPRPRPRRRPQPRPSSPRRTPPPSRPAHIPRVRSRYRFRNSGSKPFGESGMKWMNGGAKRLCN